jgi:Glycosyl transferases group 1
MKLFVLCRRGSIVHWAADSVAAFRAAGHDVRVGIARDSRLGAPIEWLLAAPLLGAPRAAHICRTITKFSPDLILAIAPHGLPLSILQRIANLPGRPPMIGWIGDLFSTAQFQATALFDAVAYTDTGLLALHRQFALSPPAAYVPHAASPGIERAVAEHRTRLPRMMFVAHPTSHRREVIGRIRTPIALYGKGWTAFPQVAHAVHDRQVQIDELACIYHAYVAALNIRHEEHVLAGLNQRHFDPCLAATPVVSDDQPDLPHCFEPGQEVLVYHNTDELNDIYAKLQREPSFAARIGEMARRRVLAEHTYARRLEALAGLVR